MEEYLLKLATNQGIWSVLAVFLIFYILKKQEERDLNQEIREKNYQKVIFKLANELKIVQDIRNDIQKIKENVIK